MGAQSNIIRRTFEKIKTTANRISNTVIGKNGKSNRVFSMKFIYIYFWVTFFCFNKYCRSRLYNTFDERTRHPRPKRSDKNIDFSAIRTFSLIVVWIKAFCEPITMSLTWPLNETRSFGKSSTLWYGDKYFITHHVLQINIDIETWLRLFRTFPRRFNRLTRFHRLAHTRPVQYFNCRRANESLGNGHNLVVTAAGFVRKTVQTYTASRRFRVENNCPWNTTLV